SRLLFDLGFLTAAGFGRVGRIAIVVVIVVATGGEQSGDHRRAEPERERPAQHLTAVELAGDDRRAQLVKARMVVGHVYLLTLALVPACILLLNLNVHDPLHGCIQGCTSVNSAIGMLSEK